MSLEIGRASPEAMPAVRELVDEAFVRPRGGTLPMARRLPHVLADGNAANVFVAEDAGRVVGVVATRPFTWIADGEEWPAAMVGLVATLPSERGRGIASAVLREVEHALREGGASFAVLWAAEPGFYERLGWRSGDVGVLGQVTGFSLSLPGEALELDDALVETLDAVRRRWEPRRVERRPVDWHPVPAPVQEVRAVIAGPADVPIAYALVGLTDNAGYIYELTGDEAAFTEVWAALRAGGRRLFVNDSRDSRSHRWLEAHADVSWREQCLSMWLPLDPRAERVECRAWHVPWIDRV